LHLEQKKLLADGRRSKASRAGAEEKIVPIVRQLKDARGRCTAVRICKA